jgi:hypothetical protein
VTNTDVAKSSRNWMSCLPMLSLEKEARYDILENVTVTSLEAMPTRTKRSSFPCGMRVNWHPITWTTMK